MGGEGGGTRGEALEPKWLQKGHMTYNDESNTLASVRTVTDAILTFGKGLRSSWRATPRQDRSCKRRRGLPGVGVGLFRQIRFPKVVMQHRRRRRKAGHVQGAGVRFRADRERVLDMPKDGQAY